MKFGKECVCGRGGECQGISAAFALLKDPRRGYVQLPQFTPEPTCYEEAEMNAMRASYLRHLRRTEQSLGDSEISRCVALHHFHPTIVLKHSQMPNAISPIPKTLRKVDVQYLKMELDDKDRVRDEMGRKRKQFYCVPNWPIESAKEDLKVLIRANRIYQEAKMTSPQTPDASTNLSVVVPVGSTPRASGGTPIEPRNLEGPLAAAASPPVSQEEKTPVAPVEQAPTEEVVKDDVGVSSPSDEATLTGDETDVPAALVVSAAAATVLATAPKVEEEKADIETAPTESAVLEEKATEVEDTEPATQVDTVDGEGAEPVALEEGKEEVDDSTFALSSVPITKRIFETVFNEEKLPSHYSTQSEEGRQFLFRRMSKFEARRLEVCAPLVEEFVVRWTASLRVMQAGIFEMARAERLIRGAALANKAYAEAMQANFEDVYLDSEGNSVTEKRQQLRIAKAREESEYAIESSGGSPEKSKEAYTRSAVFGSLVNSQEVIAGKFLDNYENVNENVVSELAHLRSNLKEEMIEFKRRGDPFIRDIQASETEIQTTFAVFDIVGPCPGELTPLASSSHSKRGFFRGSFSGGTPVAADGSYHGTPLSRSNHGSPEPSSTADSHSSPSEKSRNVFRRGKRGGSSHGSPGSAHGPGSPALMSSAPEEASPQLGLDPALLSHASSPIASALRNNTIVRDGWLIEMLYREAVNAQVKILQQCGGQLEEIWQAMHRIEVNRRIRLHEVMLDFMPRQRRLFLGLSPIPGPILNDLVQQRTDPQHLEEQLEDDIRKHMETLLKIDNSKRSHIMNRSRASAPNFDELHGMLTGEFFDNGLLRAAKVAERKSGVLGNWKTTLAVVTGDKYLHMFDVSFIPQIAVGCPAEAVFDLLLPDFEIASIDSEVITRRGDSLLKKLTPMDTVDLAKCSSYVSDDARTMDIVESGVKGIIGFDATRKFTLRMITPRENQDWLTVVQSCHKSGGDPSPSTGEPSLEEEQVLRAVQNAEAQLALWC